MAQLLSQDLKTMLDNAWFSLIPDSLKRELIDCSRLRHFNDKELLWSKGQLADGWYGLVEGAIRISSSSHHGKEGILTFMEPGTWFGEISLFDGLPRTHDSLAQGACRVLVVEAMDFKNILARNPILYPHFINLHCHRMRTMFVAMEDWNMLPLESRLMKQLFNLAQSHSQAHPEGAEISLHFPQEVLAQLLGVSRQRVNQCLNNWARDGRIQLRYGKIIVSQAFLEEAYS